MNVEDKMVWKSFINEYHQKVRKAEDEILIKVLAAYLGYEPTDEDYKRCQMVYRYPIDDEYTFCYDKTPLGFISHSFENLSYIVTFTPKK